jgi:acetylglutamate kinase
MTRVIKLGGRVQQNPSLAATIARLWDHGKHRIVIMHGGGDAVTELQKAYGVEPRFDGGRRVTSARDVDLVRMALSGLANKQLVSALVAAGVNAVGISGEDDGLIGATPLDAERYGHVGEVTTVQPSIIEALLAARFLPVISPVSRNVSSTLGAALNVNGDDAAAVLAVALDATELLLVADVQGVLFDGEMLSSLQPTSARDLIARNIAVKGMAAKLEAALVAVEGGVPRVRIGDVSMLLDDATGTTVRSGVHTDPKSSRSARDLRAAAPAHATAGVVQ